MKEYEYYRKVDEILAQFGDPEKTRQRFNESALFNSCVQWLSRGMNHYELILELVNIAEETQKTFEQHLLHGPPPIYIANVLPEDIEKMKKK